MTDIKQHVGNRIRHLRHNTGYSQEILAHQANLDRTYINSVENGRRNISIVNLEKIVTALDITLADFFSTPEFDKDIPND